MNSVIEKEIVSVSSKQLTPAEINKIIRFYVGVYNGRDVGEDVIQNIWVELLEKDLLGGEKNKARDVIHGLVKNHINKERTFNKDVAPPSWCQLRNLYARGIRKDINVDDYAPDYNKVQGDYSLLYDEYDSLLLLYPNSVSELSIFSLFFAGEQQPSIECNNFENTDKKKNNDKLLNNTQTQTQSFFKSICISDSKAPEFGKILEKSQNSFPESCKSNNSKGLEHKNIFYHTGYNNAVKQHFKEINPNIIDKVIKFINDGWADTQIYRWFATDRKTHRYFLKKPRLSHLFIKTIRHLCQSISSEYADYLKMPDNPLKIVNLYDLMYYLKYQYRKSRVVYADNIHLLVFRPCPQCNKRKSIQVFADETTGDLVWCCMKCRAKDELHELYVKYRGKDLSALFRLLQIPQEEDYQG